MLLGLLDKHWEQLAADFPRFYSMTLSEVRDRATAREFAAMAVNLPRESATWRALHGADHAEWDTSAQLIAEVANAVRWLQWAESKDGQANRNRPKLILPPWEEDENREVKVFGKDPVSIAEMDEFLGWNT